MAVARTRGREVETAPPKSDIYTGLLAISLIAMITGCVLLYLDYNSYPQQKAPTAPPPTISLPSAGQPAPATQPQPTPAPETPPATPPATPPM